MMDTTQLAAIIASGLVNNDLYKKCTRIADWNKERPAEYVLDVEGVARDAMAITRLIEQAERDANRVRR